MKKEVIYMKYINKKTKILLIILIAIMAIGISYYAYQNEKESQNIIEQQNLEIEENKQEESSKETEKIIVHVSGAVQNEGVIELEKNSRIADAIEKAGGFREDAYTKDVNLAYKLEDGMKIYIPTMEEKENEKANVIVESNIETENNNNSYSNTDEGKNVNSKVNINTASKEELDTLPGIGPSTAEKIINYRKEKGKFKSIEEIKDVSGIGDSKYENIKDMIEI